MFKVIKKNENRVSAYRLGDKSEMLDKLFMEKKIRKISNNTFEIFSQEAINGRGEIAHIGDYVKIDNAGFPYPNEKTFFSENHYEAGENEYIQIPHPLDAWTVDEPMCAEIEFLINHKGLIISEDNPDEYFSAPLWGTTLSAPRSSVIIFYSIFRNSESVIIDIDYNFVKRDEFEKTYIVL